MFDFGWQEFLVIAFVLVLVVGPKDLPKVLKTVTKYIRNMRQMASEFHKIASAMHTLVFADRALEAKNA